METNFIQRAALIEGNASVADKIGRELASMLNLTRDRKHADRWETAWGNKTNCGLARATLRVILETPLDNF